MSRQFDFDWFTGPAYTAQQTEARLRCVLRKFPSVKVDAIDKNPKAKRFHDELEVRTLLYLRDGFSYEVKELVDLNVRGMLTFECEPVEEQYKVGAFVVALQFEEIVRVEVFAVHPKEKPEDVPLITGFRGSPDGVPFRDDPRDVRDPRLSPIDEGD